MVRTHTASALVRSTTVITNCPRNYIVLGSIPILNQRRQSLPASSPALAIGMEQSVSEIPTQWQAFRKESPAHYLKPGYIESWAPRFGYHAAWTSNHAIPVIKIEKSAYCM